MLRYVRWLRLQTLDKVSPRRYVLIGGAIVAVVAGLGALDTFGVISVKALDLDGEKNVPAFTSGFLLLGAAFAAGAFWLATGIDGRSRWERGAALVMAALFLYMSADEVGQLHEKAERITGIDWQTLFLPVFAVAAVATVLVLRSWRGQPVAGALLIAGAVAWVMAQIGEHLEYDSHDVEVAGFQYLVLFEETFEMVGTLLLTAAFIQAGQRTLHRVADRRTTLRVTSAGSRLRAQ
ncbi:MAG TPA: hypothetical protein VGB19_03715 [Actinomycetota bacterium]